MERERIVKRFHYAPHNVTILGRKPLALRIVFKGRTFVGKLSIGKKKKKKENTVESNV